jgi:hypothetical protein
MCEKKESCAIMKRASEPSRRTAKSYGEMANRTPDLSKISKDANGMLYQLNHIPIDANDNLSKNSMLM